MIAAMQTIDLDRLPFTGALDRDHTADGGIVLRRLPDWTRAQIVDPALAVLLTMPAGVRIELETDATELELDVLLTVLQLGDRPVVPAAFDLVVDGDVVDVQRSNEGIRIVVDMRTGAIDFQPGSPTTIRFAGLPGRAGTRVEVWLPHAAVVEVRGARVNDGASWTPAAPRGRRWIHHGSSISHCMEAEQPTATWPAIAARLGDLDLLDLAFAGQCMLDPQVARTMRDEPADVLSLKIGINIINGDTMRERTFVPALHGFLDTVRDGHPDTPFLVLTPIAFPTMEDRPGPTVQDGAGSFVVIDRPAELMTGALTLARIRELVTMVVEGRRQAGDANLHLLDGRLLFPEDEAGDLPDGLHPNPAGYRRMGERFARLALGDGGPLSAR
jgi:hypothetical protein